jgi:hypothetical protein
MLSDANTNAANAALSSRNVHRGLNIFRPIPISVSDLPKPDLCNPMQIGMHDNLQKWIFHCMETHEWLD